MLRNGNGALMARFALQLFLHVWGTHRLHVRVCLGRVIVVACC